MQGMTSGGASVMMLSLAYLRSLQKGERAVGHLSLKSILFFLEWIRTAPGPEGDISFLSVVINLLQILCWSDSIISDFPKK